MRLATAADSAIAQKMPDVNTRRPLKRIMSTSRNVPLSIDSAAFSGAAGMPR